MSGFDSYRVRERADIARWVLIGAFLVLSGAFFRTQIIQHDKFQLKAETNRLRPIALTPPRGAILDRHGRIIAENVPGYSVKLLAPTGTRSARCSPGSAASFRSTRPIPRRSSAATRRPATSRRSSSATRPFETIARLEEHRAVLPGLVIQSEPKRLYPAGKAVAHLVGYVAEVTESDLNANRFPGARPRLDRRQGGARAGVRRHAPRRRRRPLHRGERPRPAGARRGQQRHAPADAGQADQHDDRPRPPALHRQHLAARACAARWSR